MIDVNQLKALIKAAFDNEADNNVSPEQARDRIAEALANAINQFVVGRTTTVTGTSVSGGSVRGTGVID